MNKENLRSRLKNGEKKAMEQIYLDHVDLLFRYGSRFSRNTQLVEDCIQDLFIELWKNRKGLGATDSIKRYLLASIRRKIIKQVEKKKKWLSTDEYENVPFDCELAIEDSIVEMETKAEMSDQLRQAFEGLTKRQKEAVYLKYYAGLDYEDIGAVMNIGYQSLRNLISGAIKKMKENVGTIGVIMFLLTFFPINDYKLLFRDL